MDYFILPIVLGFLSFCQKNSISLHITGGQKADELAVFSLINCQIRLITRGLTVDQSGSLIFERVEDGSSEHVPALQFLANGYVQPLDDTVGSPVLNGIMLPFKVETMPGLPGCTRKIPDGWISKMDVNQYIHYQVNNNGTNKESVFEVNTFLAEMSIFNLDCNSTKPLKLEWRPNGPQTPSLRVTYGYGRGVVDDYESTKFYSLHATSIDSTVPLKFSVLQNVAGRYKIFWQNFSTPHHDDPHLNFFVRVVDEDPSSLDDMEDHFFSDGGSIIPDGISFDSPNGFSQNAWCNARSDYYQDGLQFGLIFGQNVGESRLLYWACADQIESCSSKVIKFSPDPSYKIRYRRMENIFQNGLLVCGTPKNYSTMAYFTALNFQPMEYRPQYLKDALLIQVHLSDDMGSLNYSNIYENDLRRPPIQLYDKTAHPFECQFVDYVLDSPLMWSFKYVNGSVTTHFVTGDQWSTKRMTKRSWLVTGEAQDFYFHFKFHQTIVNTSRDMQEISCSSYHFNSDRLAKSSLRLDVVESRQPSFRQLDHYQKSQIMVTKNEGDNFSVKCHLEEGRPEVTFSWTKDGQELTNNSNGLTIKNGQSDLESILQFWHAAADQSGLYRCSAQNYLGGDQKQFAITINKRQRRDWMYIAGFSVLGLAFLIFVAAAHRIYKRQKQRLSSMEIELFRKGDHKKIPANALPHEVAQYLPYDDRFEVRWTNFVEEKEIGGGAFGVVTKGQLDGVTVAAKTIRPGAEKAELLALLYELKILMHLETHAHVVKLVAACTAHLDVGKAWLFVEFCALGSIDTFLMEHRSLYVKRNVDIPVGSQRSLGEEEVRAKVNHQFDHDNSLTRRKTKKMENLNGESNSTKICTDEIELNSIPLEEVAGYSMVDCPDDDLLVVKISNLESTQDEHPIEIIKLRDLLIWSAQIANAMEFLESKKIVHADLACRNVLLRSFHEVKVTDFGLSRHLGRRSEYEKKPGGLIPWRWMAVESLRDRIYTTKSDVWSYGVTLWEIFSLGSEPFAALDCTVSIVAILEGGLRLPRPNCATDRIYKQMNKCWSLVPADRPTFSELEQFFLSFVDHPVDLDHVHPDPSLEPPWSSSKVVIHHDNGPLGGYCADL